MSKRIPISFKETEEELKLLEFLLTESNVIGQSSYVKLLLQKEMLKKEKESK